MILPETHCLAGETIILENYSVFHNNRNVINKNRTHGSGGIAIAVSNKILQDHIILNITRGIDGQISMKLKNRYNDFILGILGLYLAPENYIYGKDAENFFIEATALFENLSDCDLRIGGGDLNARTKEIEDFIPDIDGNLVPKRTNPDKTKNAHTDSFIPFLKDNRCVILNGRITPKFNNFTFICPRGLSVPDYLFCPLSEINSCKEIKVLPVSEIINYFELQPPRNLPDHSIIMGTFFTSHFSSKNSNCAEHPSNNTTNINTPRKKPPKKNIKKMSEYFFLSQETFQQILETIDRIENCLKNQAEINRLWSEVKSIFMDEINTIPNLPVSNSKKQNRTFRKSQPFWNEHLAGLWINTCHAEKAYTNFKVKIRADQTIKYNLRNIFKTKQQTFDRTFRRYKRAYNKQKLIDLENLANKKDKTDMWSTLKRLNNPTPPRVVLEIVRADNTISNDLKEIIERWHADISKLFSGIKDNPEIVYDEEFYSEIIRKKAEFESFTFEEQNTGNIYDPNMINSEITYSEVSEAIDNLKKNKAFLDIPNEALKNINSKLLLHKFFSLCFDSGCNPTDWNYSDIKPISKKGKDQRDPLQNRCITIMCCVAKLYSRILNTRLQKYLESNEILVEEQNGFRATKSCIDHIFVLCTILRNRNISGKETFLCFIDFQKAFDSIDRNFLLYKLSQIGINGNMYCAISSLYNNPKSRIILNDYETNYFDCPIGVKQGDCLSPTLFAIFINDLALEIKDSKIGLNIDGNLLVNILLYADDIVLLSENEKDLQSLLFIVERWCQKWRLDVNLSKTNILHIRGIRKPQSKFMFFIQQKTCGILSSLYIFRCNIK